VTDDKGECLAPASFETEEVTCDGLDNDCDGDVDEGPGALVLYRDADADGYGTSADRIRACVPTAGYVENSGDCNDADAAVRPGVVDLKDWVDNDCDDVIDEDAGRNMASVLTTLHNQVRAAASPAPTPPLPPLVWDAQLAAFAQARAEKLSKRCELIHSPNRGSLGENLAKAGRSFSPEQVVQLWASEAAHYELRRNRCARGEVCGHYTQIVWRSTTALGCGTSACRSSPLPMSIWVCNYKPPGNWRGKRPY